MQDVDLFVDLLQLRDLLDRHGALGDFAVLARVPDLGVKFLIGDDRGDRDAEDVAQAFQPIHHRQVGEFIGPGFLWWFLVEILADQVDFGFGRDKPAFKIGDI